jgi:hypothetical protein
MGKVAAQEKLQFVDLFHHSQEMMKLGRILMIASPLRNLEGQKRDRFGFPTLTKEGRHDASFR